MPVDTTDWFTPYRDIIVSLLLLVHRRRRTIARSFHLNSRRYQQLIPQDRTQDVFKSYRHHLCSVLKHIGISTNNVTYLPWRLKVPGIHTVSSCCPVQLHITFTKDQHNLLKCNSTCGQVHKYTRSLGISCLRGTINWSFNVCFIIFYFMWRGELFTIKFIRPKHLEFISHFANHAYHMLRFVNTIHKPLLVDVYVYPFLILLEL